jgi:hypothetical protein
VRAEARTAKEAATISLEIVHRRTAIGWQLARICDPTYEMQSVPIHRPQTSTATSWPRRVKTEQRFDNGTTAGAGNRKRRAEVYDLPGDTRCVVLDDCPLPVPRAAVLAVREAESRVHLNTAAPAGDKCDNRSNGRGEGPAKSPGAGCSPNIATVTKQANGAPHDTLQRPDKLGTTPVLRWNFNRGPHDTAKLGESGDTHLSSGPATRNWTAVSTSQPVAGVKRVKLQFNCSDIRPAAGAQNHTARARAAAPVGLQSGVNLATTKPMNLGSKRVWPLMDAGFSNISTSTTTTPAGPAGCSQPPLSKLNQKPATPGANVAAPWSQQSSQAQQQQRVTGTQVEQGGIAGGCGHEAAALNTSPFLYDAWPPGAAQRVTM